MKRKGPDESPFDPEELRLLDQSGSAPRDVMPKTGVSPRQTDRKAESLPTSEFLQRVALELDRLSILIGGVENVIPLVLANRVQPASTETLAALQQLDLVAQTVASLSAFLQSAALAQMEGHVPVEAALKTITLADLSARLGAVEIAGTDRFPASGSRKGASFPSIPNEATQIVELF